MSDQLELFLIIMQHFYVLFHEFEEFDEFDESVLAKQIRACKICQIQSFNF